MSGRDGGGAFDGLSPQLVIATVEQVYGLSLDGTMVPYPSYVNRVYGLRTEDGEEYVAKFYRPGRWSVEALEEEHEFVLECAEADLPVVAPVADPEGFTLATVGWEGGDEEFAMALYPKKGGRGFDAERDDDWYRLGALAGRVHQVGARKDAPSRLVCTPDGSTAGFLAELRDSSLVHPDCAGEFFDLAEWGLELIRPLFEGRRLQRIHGDFHRGNVLDRGADGLLLIDFDDMMMGPAVQDLWLLLPDRIDEVRRELTHIIAGYEDFADFEYDQFSLVEPLRFMRMLYYLSWNATQRQDHSFRKTYPDWGGRAFWMKEVEDLRTQLSILADGDESAYSGRHPGESPPT